MNMKQEKLAKSKWRPKKNLELKADNANKIQPAITAWEKVSKGETVSDEFILRAIKALDKANKKLERKQLKTIRRKLSLLLPENLLTKVINSDSKPSFIAKKF